MLIIKCTYLYIRRVRWKSSFQLNLTASRIYTKDSRLSETGLFEAPHKPKRNMYLRNCIEGEYFLTPEARIIKLVISIDLDVERSLKIVANEFGICITPSGPTVNRQKLNFLQKIFV